MGSEPGGGAGKDVEQQICGRRGAAGAQEKVKCGALCRGELGSDVGALVCLKRSGCSMWAILQVPVLPFVLTSTSSPSLPSAHPVPC